MSLRIHLFSSRRVTVWYLVFSLLLSIAPVAEGDGLLLRDGTKIFPIGFYELPQDDASLEAMADSGVNLVRCGTKEDLDRAQAAGLMGWMPLSLQQGPTEDLRALVESVKDHPALAVWEGPDEIVWNFTAYSGLYKSMGVYESKDEWWRQTPRAIEYSESKAGEIIPNMRAAAEVIRSVDTRGHQVWINEALKSDVRFVRQYLPFVDIVGCDTYPVSTEKRKIESLAGAVERWKMAGRGKPVWMVLQAFSWDELGDKDSTRGTAYPSFAESRFMAYDSIAHGAKGILYWGSHYLKSAPCRQSLYALTAELAALQPFLVVPEEKGARVRLVELPEESAGTGVALTVRCAGADWLVVLVNEDGVAHMGVEVSGLEALEGRELAELYSPWTASVSDGELVVRMQPLEVKVFATSRSMETARREGRDYTGQ